MALPGIGYRSVWSLALEISHHLVEPCLATTLSTAVSAPGSVTVQVPSLGTPTPAVYVGALLVVDFGSDNQELIQVAAFDQSASPPEFTAVFAFAHPIGAPVIGPTFPTQSAAGDPFFTQTEILSYIARAQHEFLSRVPAILSMNTQTVRLGQVYQPLVCSAIEIARIASSAIAIPLASTVRTGGVVTAASVSPHGLEADQKFTLYGSPSPSFNGSFMIDTVPGPSAFTYRQYGPDESADGGSVVLWKRLYETSQEELSMQDPGWRNQNIAKLSSWYEDRTGLYQFGVDGKPASDFPVEILSASRDSSSLALTDGFLVPDPMLHFVKYKALEYCWSKDGEQRDPRRAEYCRMRFDRGVLAARRWLEWTGVASESQPDMEVARG